MISSDTPLVHCPHAKECAGCPQIEFSREATAQFKTARVASAFSRYEIFRSLKIAPLHCAKNETHYRTRAKLVVSDRGIGLYSRHEQHVVVDVVHCQVFAPVVERVVDSLRALVNHSDARALRAIELGGALTAIDVREVVDGNDNTRALLTLILREDRLDSDAELREVCKTLEAAAPEILSIGISIVKEKAVQLLGGTPRVILGDDAAVDRIGLGSTYQLAAHGSFIQANRAQTAALHNELLAHLEMTLKGLKNRRILDLYGGSGALGLMLAQAGADVVLVESYEPAVALANRAAAAQSLETFKARAGDAALISADLALNRERFDAVIVNPPRRGIAAEVRAAIGALAPRALVYVSCEPETLARDAADLHRFGYTLKSALPFDMIPLTDEVETLAFFAKNDIPAARVIFENAEIVAVEKCPHEPTTPQGEHAISLLDRVQKLPGAKNATPIHRLDADTSGVCIFAKDPKFVEAWSNALTAGQKSYVTLAQGVLREKGLIEKPLPERGKIKTARTELERIGSVGVHSLIFARPREGRTHQIRRHLAMIKHAIIGDERYGHRPTNRHFIEKYGLDRSFLHCASIVITNPHSQEKISLYCALPGDLNAVLARFDALSLHEKISALR